MTAQELIKHMAQLKKYRTSSYGSEEHFGILCTLERILDNVTLLDPIWIWSE
jgi:hypothetical protein